MKSLVGLDVVIIGAGAVGVSTAYFLQRAGMRVTLLDHAVNADISRLDVQGDRSIGRGYSSSLNCQGTRLFADVISDLGYVFESDKTCNFNSLSPSAPVSAIGCSASDGEILADSIQNEITCAIKDRGGRVFDDVEVIDLVLRAGKVVGVTTNQGQFLGDEVIVSSASLSSKIELQYGLDFGPQHYAIAAACSSEEHVACATSELSYVGRPEQFSGTIVALGSVISPQLAFMVAKEVENMVSRPWEQKKSASSYPVGRSHMALCL